MQTFHVIPWALAALLLGAFFVFGALGWPGEFAGAGGMFCEAFSSSWVKQPANTWSNLGFVVAGLWMATYASTGRRAEYPSKILVLALDQTGADTESVLSSHGLVRESFDDPEAFLHALVMYQLLENFAVAADDPNFCAKIGEKMDTSNWHPLLEASKDATSLGDFLTACAIVATDHSSSTQHSLVVRGRSAEYRGTRSFEVPFVPAQVDALFAALFSSVIRRSLGAAWRADEVMIRVSDPDALPPVFHGIKAVKGDRRGHGIMFPARWLTHPFDRPEFLRRSKADAGPVAPPRVIADSVREAVKPHIGHGAVTNVRAAEICGMSEQTLRRRLAKEGNSLGQIVDDLKSARARELVGESDAAMSEIAAALGFSDATSFSRTFKRWTGMAPSQFRRSGRVA